MHLILALLGLIVTVLILTNQLANNKLSFGWLNPFSWLKSQDKPKKLPADDPVYVLEEPQEVIALLIMALAKSDGGMSAAQKKEILAQFTQIFQLNNEKAANLLSASTFLLHDDMDMVKKPQQLFAASKKKFSQAQIIASINLLKHIASFDSPMTAFQAQLIADVEQYFAKN